MRRSLISIAITLLIAGSVLAVLAQRRSAPARREAVSEYTLTGPYTHDNLTVYLIHGAEKLKGKAPATLEEALARKSVIVHETQDVNELAIENIGDEDVYVQAGDIVKGGQQDRTLAHDLIVPPRSGRMALEAFCVEQGRWSARGSEAVSSFSASQAQLNSKELKLAAKKSRSQREVWEKVAESQEKIAKNLGQPALVSGGVLSTPSPAPPPPPPAALAPASPTSLQLTLENREVKRSSQEYTRLLSTIVNDKPDAIGYVFAINGRVNSADVYGSRALFRKLWPKLLEASAVESLSERDGFDPASQVTVEMVREALEDAASGKMETRDVTARVRLVTRESEKGIFYETRDRAREEAWIHRNYLTK